jgi:hypothetical protein
MVGAGVGVLGGVLIAVESNALLDLVASKRTEKQDATFSMMANVAAAGVALGGIFLGGKFAYDQYNAAKSTGA